MLSKFHGGPSDFGHATSVAIGMTVLVGQSVGPPLAQKLLYSRNDLLIHKSVNLQKIAAILIII